MYFNNIGILEIAQNTPEDSHHNPLETDTESIEVKQKIKIEPSKISQTEANGEDGTKE